jgi:hypothetical protein
MKDVQKYRLVARSLREQAMLPGMQDRRVHTLELAEFFEQLALDTEVERMHRPKAALHAISQFRN